MKKLEEEKRKYEVLSPEEKQNRLLKGLYNYQWSSFDEDSEIGHS